MKLKELITELIDSDEKLEKEINTYLINSKKIEKKQKSIQHILDDINKKSKLENTRLKEIKKYMVEFNITEKKSKKWVAKLNKVLKYKYPSASYKTLWLEALNKVNKSTRNVLLDLEKSQIELKKKETKQELIISENILTDLWISIRSLFVNIKKFKKVVNQLPKIKE